MKEKKAKKTQGKKDTNKEGGKKKKKRWIEGEVTRRHLRRHTTHRNCKNGDIRGEDFFSE